MAPKKCTSKKGTSDVPQKKCTSAVHLKNVQMAARLFPL
jgi:hypothetical protein